MSPESVVAAEGPFLTVAKNLSLLAATAAVTVKVFQQFEKTKDPIAKFITGVGTLISAFMALQLAIKVKLVDSIVAAGRAIGQMISHSRARVAGGGAGFMDYVRMRTRWGGLFTPGGPPPGYDPNRKQGPEPPMAPFMHDDYPGGSGPPSHDYGSGIAGSGRIRSAVHNSGSWARSAGRMIGSSKTAAAVMDAVKPALRVVGQYFAGSLMTVLGALILAPIVKLGTWFMQTANQVAVGLTRSGGTSGNDLHRLASRLGMNGGQLGGAAQQFGELLSQGGIAAGFAAKLGIKPYGGLGGDQNSLNKFITALKAVAYEKDPSQAARMARYFGMEDLSWVRNADETHKRMLFEGGGAAMSAEELTKAANAQIDFNRALADFQDTLRNIGAFVLPMITSALKNMVAILIGAFIGAVSGVPFGGLIGGLAGWGVSHAIGSGMDARADSQYATMDNHTKAMKRHTSALETNSQMLDGSYGGGPLFNGNLIPRGWGQQLIDQAANGRSIALGAFSI